MPTLWLGKEREARCEKWCVQGPLGEEHEACCEVWSAEDPRCVKLWCFILSDTKREEQDWRRTQIKVYNLFDKKKL